MTYEKQLKAWLKHPNQIDINILAVERCLGLNKGTISKWIQNDSKLLKFENVPIILKHFCKRGFYPVAESLTLQDLMRDKNFRSMFKVQKRGDYLAFAYPSRYHIDIDSIVETTRDKHGWYVELKDKTVSFCEGSILEILK